MLVCFAIYCLKKYNLFRFFGRKNYIDNTQVSKSHGSKMVN